MTRGRKKKNPFDDLSNEFKDAVAGSTPEQIKQRIAQVAMDDQSLREARDEDQQLAEAKEAAKQAGEVYRDGAKMNRLKIRWCKEVLESKGKV
jgi:hypothetical protein